MTKLKHPLYRVLSIAIAVVFFWRGVWGLMDLYIFPDNLTLSYIISLVIGLGILTSTRMLYDQLI